MEPCRLEGHWMVALGQPGARKPQLACVPAEARSPSSPQLALSLAGEGVGVGILPRRAPSLCILEVRSSHLLPLLTLCDK